MNRESMQENTPENQSYAVAGKHEACLPKENSTYFRKLFTPPAVNGTKENSYRIRRRWRCTAYPRNEHVFLLLFQQMSAHLFTYYFQNKIKNLPYRWRITDCRVSLFVALKSANTKAACYRNAEPCPSLYAAASDGGCSDCSVGDGTCSRSCSSFCYGGCGGEAIDATYAAAAAASQLMQPMLLPLMLCCSCCCC